MIYYKNLVNLYKLPEGIHAQGVSHIVPDYSLEEAKLYIYQRL